LKKNLEVAKDLYLRSRFEDSLRELSAIWVSMDSAALALESEFPKEVLLYTAASEFFRGEEKLTKQYMRAILDLDDEYFINAQAFPPEFIQLFSEVKAEKRWPRRTLLFRSNVNEVRAKFLGSIIPVEKGQLFSISLPVKHPILEPQPIVLSADGKAPIMIEMAEFPSELNFESIEPQRLETSDLFGVLGNLTLSPQQRDLFERLGADILLLGNLTKDLEGDYSIKAQWLEPESDRRSPVVSYEGKELEGLAAGISLKLLPLISPEGNVYSVRGGLSALGLKKSLKPRGESLFNKWWFWTAVGVGMAGLGVGGYFLLKPEDELRFVVRQGGN